MELGMDEQVEMQPAADSLAPEDFGMSQLFWEIRDAVVVGDAETGRIVLWNPAAAALFGVPAAEAVGLSIEILVPELFRERHRAGLARFQEMGGGSIVDSGRAVELPASRRSGEQITVELTLSRITASRVPGHFVLAVIRDATERKQAELERLHLIREQAARDAAKVETALQEAEIKFRSLVEQLPAIVSLNAHDETSSTLYVSPQIEEILGYTPAAYTADPTFWLKTVHPDDLERVLAEIARTNVTGEPFRLEYRRVTRDGRVIWIIDEGVLVRDNADRPLHWQTVQLDITDRKEVEEELRQSEERFRTAFDHAAIGMSLVHLDGRFFRVNAALCDLTGYSEQELLTTTFQEITHPDDLEADLAHVARLLAGATRAFQMEKRYLRKDGQVIWIRLNSALVRNSQGAPLHFIGQLEDITERKRAEEKVRKSEARFRSLISNATDIITILDAEGIIHYESPPIKRILGYHREELLGRNAFELVHPDDRAETWLAFEHALANPSFVPTVEFRFLQSDGSWRWLEATGTNLLTDPNVGGFVVNSRDITERKRANEELRVALEAAQAANQAKGLFLDMMSHELRTPLQAVLGYSEFLLEGSERSLTAEQREDIGYIRQAGGRMIALINQMLDLSRMEAGRLELAAEPVDLVQVIEQVRQDVAPQSAAKGLALRIDLASSLPFVIGDAERLRQVLLNLVGNAVKFTDEGCVCVTAVPTAGGVDVIVSDTGIGIPADAVPFIFDEFRQVDGGLTRRHGGAGLGLAIARKLTEQMGGSINVSSDVGSGSTITLHLPVGMP
jgi:two-component system sensor histidine kinase/response regulator